MQLPTSAISHPKTMAKNERAAAMAMPLALAEQRGISTRCSSKGFATNVPYFTEFKIADPGSTLSHLECRCSRMILYADFTRLRKETFEPASLLRLSVLTRGHLDRREN